MMLSTIARCTFAKIPGRFLSSTMSNPQPATQYDSKQLAAMKEMCFVVDDSDKIVGTASKRECHEVQKDDYIPLHRAFSVFLFNSRGDLLLQKRSSNKITYPDCYTNTCCSHPIQDCEGEDEGALGVKKAAIRRLNYELGIPVELLSADKIKYLTRIHYKDTGNGKWGEHEIDYILFLLADLKLKPNPNEVSEISYIPKEHMNSFVSTLEAPLTPWFSLILKHRLRLWWDNLDKLDDFVDHEKIHKLGFSKE